MSNKVLRIGVIQRGKIIEERELDRRETVSIGTDPRATFQVTSDALPDCFDLFDYDGVRYYLRFTDEMGARLQLDGVEVSSFDDLRQSKKNRVELRDDSRGKVLIGDLTVLFQFKEPQKASARPTLPPEIRGSFLQNRDAQFTGIFVAVALLQISVVAYARNQIYVEPTYIDQIDQTYQRFIMPTAMPEPLKEETNGAKIPKAKEPKKVVRSKPKGTTNNEPPSVKKAVSKHGLLKVLGSNRPGKDGALFDVFQESQVDGTLAKTLSYVNGVDIVSNDGETGPRRDGDNKILGFGALGTGGGTDAKTTDRNKREHAVRGDAEVQPPEVDGELSETAIAGVMKRHIKSLRDCYERALKRDRTLSGKLVVRFEILESGRTTSIELKDASLGAPDVSTCIEKRAKYWRFPKPEGGTVFVAYPILFTPSG